MSIWNLTTQQGRLMIWTCSQIRGAQPRLRSAIPNNSSQVHSLFTDTQLSVPQAFYPFVFPTVLNPHPCFTHSPFSAENPAYHFWRNWLGLPVIVAFFPPWKPRTLPILFSLLTVSKQWVPCFSRILSLFSILLTAFCFTSKFLLNYTHTYVSP